MSFKLNYEVSFKDIRCGDCKRFYAIEESTYNYLCPYCALDMEQRKNEAIDRLVFRIRGFQNYIKGLKKCSKKS